MRLVRHLTLLILTTGYLLLATTSAFALPSFSTDYNILYDVNEQGKTHVIFNIAQKNNLSTVYATSFSLSLSQTNLTNIQVKDSLGPLNPDIKTTDNLTNISFDFINKIVGKDKANQFSIQYDSFDIASKQGLVWEINIPKLETNENTNSQQIALRVPSFFGQPAYIDPKPVRVEAGTYYFNSASLANKSISAIFGSSQFFRLNLSYNLNNPLDTSLATQIALPPQTPYQDVFIESLDPKAQDIQIDADGNWLAAYRIEPNTKLTIKANIIIKLSFNPAKVDLAQDNSYTRPTKYWNYDNPEIAAKSKNLNTPKSIYEFVVNTLQYNYNRLNTNSIINRQGAVWALENPLQAICTEFTDLFIAIARANNIPARELEGFAMSNNDRLKPISLTKDILHAWPEYYDRTKGTWIQIDPTWGNTTGGIDYFNKLDLNHLVFAIHGTDPNQPLPAGAYKNTESKTKDVFVQVIPPLAFPKPQFMINLDRQDRDRLYFTVVNATGVFAETNIKIENSTRYKILQPSLSLAPYGSATLEIAADQASFLKPARENLIINIDGQKFPQSVIRQPYLSPRYLWAGSVFLAAGIAFLARSLYLRRRRQKAPLHW